jgi:hypothetical protein
MKSDRWTAMLAVLARAPLVTAVLACSGASNQAPPDAQPLIATPAPAIGSGPTLPPPWVIRIDGTGALTCSGSVISANWLLTSAHCIAAFGASPPVRVVSSGSGTPPAQVAEVFPRSSGTTSPADIALVKLSGSGTSVPQRAHLWVGPPPSNATFFSISAWQLSATPPSLECGPDVSALKVLPGLRLLPRLPTATVVEALNPLRQKAPCRGDSGGAWAAPRTVSNTESRIVQFAVHRARGGVGQLKNEAVLITAADRDWIVQVVAENSPPGLSCTMDAFSWRCL